MEEGKDDMIGEVLKGDAGVGEDVTIGETGVVGVATAGEGNSVVVVGGEAGEREIAGCVLVAFRVDVESGLDVGIGVEVELQATNTVVITIADITNNNLIE